MSKKANLFEVLKHINDEDIASNSKNLRMGLDVVSANKGKHGTKVTIGIGEDSLPMEIMNDEVLCILLVVNKKEYKKIVSIHQQ